MSQSFEVDGVRYDRADLSKEGQALVDRLAFVQARLQELNNQYATLTRAKNGYIDDLKAEVIAQKSGVDLSSLFDAE